MLQFYFLSILLNLLTGLTLIFNSYSDKSQDSLKNVPEFFTNKTFKLIIGIMCCFTALVKLLTSFPGAVPVLGDLIPSVMGFLGGVALLIEYYISQSPTETKLNPKMESIFITNKKYIGVLCILSALLHFLFPKVILL
jgi:hypothetical protein